MPIDDVELDARAQQRLEVVLGVIGDDAGPPRPFDDLRDDLTVVTPAPATAPRRWLISAAAVLVLLAVAGIWWAGRDDADAPIATDAVTHSTAATPTTDAMPTATSGTEGEWFTIGVDGVHAEPPSAVSGAAVGTTSVWASDDGAFDEVLVLNRFPRDARATTLTGTSAQQITNLDGSLEQLADDGDPPDPDGGTLRGDEVRWVRPSGEVFEFASFGMSPTMLQKYVLAFADVVDAGCPCEINLLGLIGSEEAPTTWDEQRLVLDGAELVLTRSTMATNARIFGDAGGWSQVRSIAAAGREAIVVDGTRLIWRGDDHWFSLDGIPTDRLDEVAVALRPTTIGGAAYELDASMLVGSWVVRSTEARAEHAPWFILREDGSVIGADGCNRYGGPEDGGAGWSVDSNVLSPPEAMGSTAAACPPGVEPVTPFGRAISVAGSTMTAIAPDGHALTATRLDDTNAASLDDLLGAWTDGTNVFTFAADGVVTFSRQVSCDGSYSLDHPGALSVEFGACGGDAVTLAAPIFRNARVHAVDGDLVLVGDPGVTALVRAGTIEVTTSGSDPLREAVAATGADVAGAPPSAIVLGDATFCGVEDTGVLGMHSATVNDEARRCLLDAHLAGTPAVFVAVSSTDEGDPIVAVMRALDDRTIETSVDFSQDRFSAPGDRVWRSETCGRLTTQFPNAPEPPPASWFQCAADVDAAPAAPASDDPPAWFNDRSSVPLCGYEVRIEDRDEARRQCFRDAVVAGTPAELAYVSIGDEGERHAHWFRLTADGAHEVFVRVLPGAGPAATFTGWLRYECNGFTFVDDPSSPAAGLPTLDGCMPVAP